MRRITRLIYGGEYVSTESTSSNLGIIPGLRWMVHNPRWSPWLPALVMLIVPELLAIGLEGRVANPSKQYLGVFPGDLFLSFAVGAAFWLAIRYLNRSDNKRWYRSRLWHASCVTFGLLLAGSAFYGELNNTIHRYMPSAAYTQAQFVSPTNLFHYIIVAVMSYLLLAVALPALIHAPNRDGLWVLKTLIILSIVIWMVCAVILDNTLPRPNLNDVHGEWFGGWWRNLG
jgi:hypothetical protein